MRTATTYFDRKHYLNGQANAFRHAYWNYAIAKECTYWSKNEGRILQWTKLITDWHENAFRNREMARVMDFHNNAIGRALFKEHRTSSLDKILELLLKMTAQSVRIRTAMETTRHPNALVHLKDD